MSENQQRKVAIYPGSFNPLHIGHLDVLKQALSVFDEVILLNAVNHGKKNKRPPRMLMLQVMKQQLLTYLDKNERERVTIKSTSDPIYKYCKEHNISHIVRGIRGSVDLDDELAQRYYNNNLSVYLENCKLTTVFFATSKRSISSSAIRQLAEFLDVERFSIVSGKELSLNPLNDIDRKLMNNLWEAYK